MIFDDLFLINTTIGIIVNGILDKKTRHKGDVWLMQPKLFFIFFIYSVSCF